MTGNEAFDGAGAPSPQADFFASPPTSARPVPVQPFAAQPSTAQPFAAPEYTPMPYQPAGVPRSGLPAWVIIAICVPVVLVVVGILAAVAIPVFLDQRTKATTAGEAAGAATTTTVALPDTFAGLDRSADPQLEAQVASMLADVPPELRGAEGAAYSDGNAHTVFIVVARFPQAAASGEVDAVIAGFHDGLVKNIPPGVRLSDLEERAPGPLGGRISCATLRGDASGQLCAAVDAATMMFIIDLAPRSSLDPDLPRRLREGVVTSR